MTLTPRSGRPDGFSALSHNWEVVLKIETRKNGQVYKTTSNVTIFGFPNLVAAATHAEKAFARNGKLEKVSVINIYLKD